MRLIDADAAIGRYYADWEYHCITLGQDDREWLKQCIDQATTIEAMPLPCKIGDPVYILFMLKNGKPSHIVERKCTGIHIAERSAGYRVERERRYLVTKSDIGQAEHISFAKIGKTVFFTCAEAEAALAKMGGVKNG